MRGPLVLVLLAAVAGCVDGGTGPAPTTLTTGEPTPATTPAVTTPIATTPSPTPAPPPDEPRALYAHEHDYTTGSPAEPRTQTFPVSANVTHLVVNMTYTTGAAPVGSSVTLSTRLVDSTGATVLECARGSCSQAVSAPPAGEWTVRYAGAGTAKVAVRVIGTLSSASG